MIPFFLDVRERWSCQVALVVMGLIMLKKKSLIAMRNDYLRDLRLGRTIKAKQPI